MTAKKTVFLSATDILAADDLHVHVEDVPEWGGKIRLRAMSAGVAIEFASNIEANPKEGLIEILRLCAVDEDNNPLFTKKEADGLREKSMQVFMRLQSVCLEINGMKTDNKETDGKND